jgi:WD40 repeat protein
MTHRPMRLIARITRPPRRARLATAGVALVALLGSLLASGIHDTYPTTQVLQPSGLAWVTSDQIGSLTLLDGVAGQPVVNISAAQADGDALLAGQDGTTGFALDQSSGLLTRIDGSAYTTTSTVEPSIGSGTAIRFLVGAHTAYVLDEADSTVSAYDLSTLLQIGSPLSFAQGASTATAVVDASDRLWILDQGTGRLTWFTGKTTGTGTEAFTRGGASLVLADGEPVVLDTTAHRASLIAPDGSVTTRLDLGTDSADPGTSYSGATTQQALLMTDSERGTYQSCSTTLDSCGETLHAGFGGHALGPAVIADGRAFVPDYTTGTAWVLDPGGAAPPVHTGALTTAGEFDLFNRNGLIFYNDPHTSQAGTIAPDGTPKPIAKYSTATAAGNPTVSGSASASATASATPTVSALPSPKDASPTHSSSTPPPPTATVARSSGRPVPTPTPSNTGGSATYCTATSSGSSQSTSEQEGIPLGDSEKSAAQNPAPDGGGKKARSEYTPQYIIAAIGGAATVIAAVAAAIVTVIIPAIVSHPSQTPQSGASPTGKSVSSSSPSTSSAVGTSMPANPEFILQDPDNGRGVYGVEFLSNSTLATGDLNGSPYVWDLDDGKNTAMLPAVSGQQIFGLAYDPQRDLFAAGTLATNTDYQKGAVILWNASTGAYLTTLTVPADAGFGNPPVFSPDGATLAADSNDNSIYLWSATTFKPVGSPITDPGGDGDYGIAYSPKTGYLAAADHDGTTYLWDTQHDRLMQTFQDPKPGNAVSVAFSADGSLLATGDSNGNVYLWNVGTAGLIATLDGLKGGSVASIAFSPTKPILAATVGDKHTSEFCVWNTAGKLLAARPDPGTTYATKIAFSPDGNTLAVGDENVKTYIWNVSGLG